LHDYSVSSPAIAGGSRSVTINYDAIGNIQTKTDVAGAYSYPPSGAASVRPHAVSEVGSATYHYDANGNAMSGSGSLCPNAAFSL
jgi:hypothetical protein